MKNIAHLRIEPNLTKTYLLTLVLIHTEMNQRTAEHQSYLFNAQAHRVLELLDERGPIGRKRLADMLEVGEGRMRTILNFLKGSNLADSTPKGHILTESGEREFEKRSKNFLEVETDDLTVGERDVATIVRNSADKIDLGIKERDEAIKAGADGATILVFSDGEFKLLGEPVNLDAETERRLLDVFQPKGGDVIVIGTASNRVNAERGALAVAMSLVDKSSVQDIAFSKR